MYKTNFFLPCRTNHIRHIYKSIITAKIKKVLITSYSYFSGPPDPVSGCQVKNKTFTTISLECEEGYDGGLKQYFVAILCPYNTFTEVLGDSKASNVVSLDMLKCGHEISRQRNFNGPTFHFEHLPHSSPFSLAIFAQNTKVSRLFQFFRDYRVYRPGQPNCEYTMLKFQDCSASQILSEVNVSHFEAPTTAILSI